MSRTQSNISDGALLGQSEGQQNVLEKNLARQIQKILKNINCYSCYELSKTGKFHTF